MIIPLKISERNITLIYRFLGILFFALTIFGILNLTLLWKLTPDIQWYLLYFVTLNALASYAFLNRLPWLPLALGINFLAITIFAILSAIQGTFILRNLLMVCIAGFLFLIGIIGSQQNIFSKNFLNSYLFVIWCILLSSIFVNNISRLLT